MSYSIADDAKLQLLLMQHAKEHHLKLFDDVISNGEYIADACSR